MSLGRLLLDIGVNFAQFDSDMGRTARIAKKRSRAIKNAVANAMKVATTSSLIAGAAIGKMIFTTAKLGDQLSKTSQKLGVSVAFLSKYDFVASQAGTSIETVGTAIKKMQKSINDANNGLSTSIRAFDSLGISLETLNQLSPEEQFKILSEAMGKVEVQSIKTGAAMDIFGRAGTDLIPLFELTKEETDKMIESVERFGAVMNDTQANAAVEFTDALDALKKNAEGLSNTISLSLMPAFTEIIEQFNDDTIRTASDDFTFMQSTIVNLYGSVLFLSAAYQVVGQAVATMVTKSLEAFAVIQNGLENFVKRFKRGALIISSIWDDTANAKESQLAKEIAALSKETDELIAKFNDESLDNAFFENAAKEWDEARKKMDRVRDSLIKYNKENKNSKKVVKELADTVEILNTELALTDKELKSLNKDYNSIFKEFQDPMEALTMAYEEQILVIKRYALANADNEFIMGQTNLLILQLTEAHEKQKLSLESQLSPYDELIKKFKTQIRTAGALGEELRKLEAKRILEQINITQTNTSYDEYILKLKEIMDLLNLIDEKELPKAEGNFMDGFNTFMESFGELALIFANAAKTFVKVRDRNDNGRDDGQSDFDANRAAASERAAAGDYGPWAQFFAQFEQIIQGLTGGKLFGTPFELESATTFFNVGAGGATGESTTTEVRQRSWFRGREWRTIVEGLEGDALEAFTNLFDTIGIAVSSLSSSLNTSVASIIEGSFSQAFDSDGNLVSSMSEVLGRIYEETFEEFSQRLIAENLIAVLDTVLGTVMQTITTTISEYDYETGLSFEYEFDTEVEMGEASSIAERWRDDAGMLLEGTEFLVQAVADIQEGFELLTTLTATTDLIEGLVQAGETLSDTYSRVADSVEFLETALELMGMSLNLAREEFILFSVDITDAVGGLENASALWQNYFDVFYTSQERLEQQLNDMLTNRDDLLNSLGLDTNIDTDSFRQAFESVFSSLTADEVAVWLQAADAIGIVIDLENQLAETRSELTDILNEISNFDATLNMSDFALEMRRIENQLRDNIAVAVRMGASERELVMIRNYAARQMKLAMSELQSSIVSLSESIFGDNYDNIIDGYESQLSSISEQIQLLEQQQDAAARAAQAAIQSYNAQQAALERLAEFTNSLLVSQFSPLNPQEQLQIAQDQFDAAYNAAMGGDTDAINSLQGLAQTLLGLSQLNFASGSANTDIFNSVLDALNSLGLGGGFQTLPDTPAVSPELQSLYDQQREYMDRINAAQQAQNVASDLTQRQALFDMLEELAAAQNISIIELAERLGVPILALADSLGIELSEINDTLENGLIDNSPWPDDMFDGITSPGYIDEDSDEVVATNTVNDSIIRENNETQAELVLIKDAVNDMTTEIRNLLAQVAA